MRISDRLFLLSTAFSLLAYGCSTGSTPAPPPSVTAPPSIDASVAAEVDAGAVVTTDAGKEEDAHWVEIAPDGGVVVADAGPVAPAPIKVSVLPAAHRFAGVAVGTTGMPVTFTVRNEGTTPAPLGVAELKGADAAVFALVSSCPSELAADAECTLNVAYTPKVTGVASADLVMPTRGVTIPLLAEGYRPGALSITTDEAVIGPIANGSESEERVVTVTNTGTRPTGALEVIFDGKDVYNVTNFRLVRNTCGGVALAANASCLLGVRMTPEAPGLAGSLDLTDSARIIVSAKAPGDPVYAETYIRGTHYGLPKLAANSSSLGWYPTGLGVLPRGGYEIGIRNEGARPTGAASLAIEGPNASDFAIQYTNCSKPLEASRSCSVVVTFTPSNYGARLARLVATAQPGGNDVVELRGTGIAPVVLTVEKKGAGTGYVFSWDNDSGINCGTRCTSNLTPSSTGVALLVAQDSNGVSQRWTTANGCTSIDGFGRCVVELSQSHTVSMTFDRADGGAP